MKNKIILVAVAVILSSMFLTGCGTNFIKYYIRTSPDKAMEKYIEEKYGDDVTCISWSMADSYSAYWNKVSFSGKFTSEKFPEETIVVSASLKDNMMDYVFHDDYQQMKYLDGVKEIMESTASKYFTGEYYVITDAAGLLDDESVEPMEFDEYVKRWLRYRVCIFVESMDDEEAYDAMLKFVDDVEGQGFRSNLYLARNVEYDKDIFLEMMSEKEFDPWGSGGYKWLYKKKLSLTEEDD